MNEEQLVALTDWVEALVENKIAPSFENSTREASCRDFMFRVIGAYDDE